MDKYIRAFKTDVLIRNYVFLYSHVLLPVWNLFQCVELYKYKKRGAQVNFKGKINAAKQMSAGLEIHVKQ